MFGRSFPAFEDLNQTIAPAQLRVLRDQLESEKPPSAQLLFNYAWGLLKTDNRANQRQAIEMFSALYKEFSDMRREALYYLALGSVKVGEMSNARRYAQALLDKEPDNAQFKELKEAIDSQVTQDGLIGLTIAGGIVGIGLGVMGALLRKKR